jgi:hypothetical protein
MTSYQKLKEKNRLLSEEIVKLLQDPKYYMEQSIVWNVHKQAEKIAWYGDANTKPTGIFTGQFLGEAETEEV